MKFENQFEWVFFIFPFVESCNRKTSSKLDASSWRNQRPCWIYVGISGIEWTGYLPFVIWTSEIWHRDFSVNETRKRRDNQQEFLLFLFLCSRYNKGFDGNMRKNQEINQTKIERKSKVVSFFSQWVNEITVYVNIISSFL